MQIPAREVVGEAVEQDDGFGAGALEGVVDSEGPGGEVDEGHGGFWWWWESEWRERRLLVPFMQRLRWTSIFAVRSDGQWGSYK